MKNTNRQISPLGRSTKAENAGLSLLRPRLIEIIEDNYVYFNEILQNIYTTVLNVVSKTVSPFIARLKSKKFSHSTLQRFGSSVISIRTDFKLKRPFYQPSFEVRWFNLDLKPWNYSR